MSSMAEKHDSPSVDHVITPMNKTSQMIHNKIVSMNVLYVPKTNQQEG